MNRNTLTTILFALLALIGGAAGGIFAVSAGAHLASPSSASAMTQPASASPGSFGSLAALESISKNEGTVGSTGAPNNPLTQLGSGFTYQGRLLNSNNPVNGQYDLAFRLYDALSGGNRVGSPITLTNQTVTDGLYSVTLDFGTGVFTGDGRWLEVAVQPTNGPGFTTLAPREALTAVPYAMGLMAGAVITGTISTPMLQVTNNGNLGYGVSAQTTNGIGIVGISSSNRGVHGQSTTDTGVNGESISGSGVYGLSTSGNGVAGYSSGTTSTGSGVAAINTGTGYGLYATSSGGDGILGTGVHNGILGVTNISSASYAGVNGYSAVGNGVKGETGGNLTSGVYGVTTGNGWGVYGAGTSGIGVFGSSSGNDGVHGEASGLNRAGVAGLHIGSSGGYAIYGSSNVGAYAGFFNGNVQVLNGNFSVSGGSKNFKIDHPLDPANKYLYHSSIESPDMMDVYNGNITTDTRGEATVALPSYFEALNRDFRYQLTVIDGQFAQAVVSSKIKSNRFTIKTDKPNVEVSWLVTGIRHDPAAEKYRTQAEQDKPASEKGYYLQPELYGQPPSKSVDPYMREQASQQSQSTMGHK